MVVQHGGQKVIGRSDGVEVAGEVEVDILHRHHLGVTTTGGAALDAEHRAKGGLPQGQDYVLVQLFQRVSQPNGGGGLALSGGGRIDSGDQDQLALPGLVPQGGDVDFSLIAPIVFQQFLADPRLVGHLANWKHLRGLGDLDVSLHLP